MLVGAANVPNATTASVHNKKLVKQIIGKFLCATNAVEGGVWTQATTASGPSGAALQLHASKAVPGLSE